MINMTSRLRRLVEVWSLTNSINELGEEDTEHKLIKKAYCEIVPVNNKQSLEVANSDVNEHTYKFIFRSKSLLNLKKDWFFINNGLKYSVIYFNEDFKNNDFIEVFCVRREE